MCYLWKTRLSLPVDWQTLDILQNMTPDISIIVSVYNEELSLDEFFDELYKVLGSEELKQFSYEIVCVEDGSTDSTPLILERRAKADSRLKIIFLSRNFGKEAAMMSGLVNCAGKCAIPIDADLQDPPQVIVDFVKKWREGYDVVYGVRATRSDSFFKRKCAELFYRAYNNIADKPMPINAGDFRLLDRKVVEAVKSLPERSIFMKGLFNWVGFKSIGVEYDRPERSSGKTKWNFWKLWNFAIDGITSSTTLPLRMWTYIGFSVAGVSLIYAFYIVMRTLIRGIDVPGYASLLVLILFFSSLNLIAIGIIGEYLGRNLIEAKRRPIYIVDKTVNFDEQKKDN